MEVVQSIRVELAGLYDVSELNTFIFLMFEEYAGLSKTDIVMKAVEPLENEVLRKMQVILGQSRIGWAV